MKAPAKSAKPKTESIKAEHHSGKGTRARVNTAAEKMFFRS